MSEQSGGGRVVNRVRYEPDETPPAPLALGLGLQTAILGVAGIVLTPVIVIRAAGLGEPYLSWAVFAVLVVSGISTCLQALKLGRFGAGHVLLMGTSGAFIAISVAALRTGGPALLATLVVASALFQFALAFRLSWFRRIVTPTVAGTVIMLIAVTVMPILFGMLDDVPAGAPPFAAPLSFGVTLAVIAALALRATGALRLWAPIIGVAAGTLTGGFVGITDFSPLAGAAWIGAPTAGWPGFDPTFGADFWVLLPGFVFVTLVGAIETVGDAIAVQRVSRRRARAPDYRVVEGAVAADGVGNLLSGLLGTVPNTTYSTSISITELTGVAARRVGMCVGGALFLLAFFPRARALFLAIPEPVISAFGICLIGILFTLGMRLVAQDGMDLRKATIVGVSFWLGAGFQAQAIFSERLGGWAAALLENGMTAGGLTAIGLMLFFDWTGPRPQRLVIGLDESAGPLIDEFLVEQARRRGWSEAATARLRSAGEEALLSMAGSEGPSETAAPRRLRLTGRANRRSAEIEFVAAPGDANIEDRLALLADRPDAPEESEISLRLLRHYASSVRHQKYHDVDIVTVRVEASR